MFTTFNSSDSILFVRCDSHIKSLLTSPARTPSANFVDNSVNLSNIFFYLLYVYKLPLKFVYNPNVEMFKALRYTFID